MSWGSIQKGARCKGEHTTQGYGWHLEFSSGNKSFPPSPAPTITFKFMYLTFSFPCYEDIFILLISWPHTLTSPSQPLWALDYGQICSIFWNECDQYCPQHAFLHSTDINSGCLSCARYGPKFEKWQPVQPCLPFTSCSLSEKTGRWVILMTKDGDADLRGLWEWMAKAPHKNLFPGVFRKEVESCFLFHFPVAKWLVAFPEI